MLPGIKPYEMLGMKPRSVTCKASALRAVVITTLVPDEILFLKNIYQNLTLDVQSLDVK